MDPATVAPPSGSTDTLPAVPAGSAALMTGVVEPTAVTRAANAPVARGRYADTVFNATFAKSGAPEMASVVVGVAWMSTFPTSSPAWMARNAIPAGVVGRASMMFTIRCRGVAPARA